jgi:hypothetical protein
MIIKERGEQRSPLYKKRDSVKRSYSEERASALLLSADRSSIKIKCDSHLLKSFTLGTPFENG